MCNGSFHIPFCEEIAFEVYLGPSSFFASRDNKSCNIDTSVPTFSSDFFNCSVGTRQGCMISPFLFIFYLNELVRTCAELPAIYINEDHKNLNMLLYADDLVIIGDQVGRVQKLLDALELFCKKWGLSVNMNKTKAIWCIEMEELLEKMKSSILKITKLKMSVTTNIWVY